MGLEQMIRFERNCNVSLDLLELLLEPVLLLLISLPRDTTEHVLKQKKQSKNTLVVAEVEVLAAAAPAASPGTC